MPEPRMQMSWVATMGAIVEAGYHRRL